MCSDMVFGYVIYRFVWLLVGVIKIGLYDVLFDIVVEVVVNVKGVMLFVECV